MSNILDETKIDKLAYLSIKRGVALNKGQNLLITAPIESLQLVRKICEYAYKEGANIVTPLFTDADITNNIQPNKFIFLFFIFLD